MAQWNSGRPNLAGVLMVGKEWVGKKSLHSAEANIEMLLPYRLNKPLFCSAPGRHSSTSPRTLQSFSSLRHLRTHMQARDREMTMVPSGRSSSPFSHTTCGLKLYCCPSSPHCPLASLDLGRPR